MNSETKIHFDRAMEVLRHREDFHTIDLKMVHAYATAFMILKKSTGRFAPVDGKTVDLLANLKEFINDIADILNLDKFPDS